MSIRPSVKPVVKDGFFVLRLGEEEEEEKKESP